MFLKVFFVEWKLLMICKKIKAAFQNERSQKKLRKWKLSPASEKVTGNTDIDLPPTSNSSALKIICPTSSAFRLDDCFICFLRYESSTLIPYKGLSSTIFQSCQWVSESGMRDTLPNLHFLQYIKAWMSSTDPVSSITNCYRLIVSYTDPVHSFIIS